MLETLPTLARRLRARGSRLTGAVIAFARKGGPRFRTLGFQLSEIFRTLVAYGRARWAALHRRLRNPWAQRIAAATVLVLLGGALLPVLSGRTSSPETARQTALQAYEEAARRNAAHWAPESLAVATSLLDSSLTEYRRQAARPLSLRNYETSRRLFEQAEAHAWNAAHAAQLARRAAQKKAEAEVQRTSKLLDIGRDFAALMPLSPQERREMAQARVWSKEAEALLRAEKFEAAAALSSKASTLAAAVGTGCSQRAGRFADLRLLEDWRKLRAETIAWSRRSKQAAIVVSKAAHTLTLYQSGVVKQLYEVDLGVNSVAPKQMAGDSATPEGKYRIVEKKDVGQSIYYKALLLDYPTEADLAAFKELRRSGVSTAGPGGQIEIHGEGGRRKDWTRGCMALTNDEMDALFAAVRVGTPVAIVGHHGEGGPLVDLVLRFRETLGEESP